MRLPVRYPQHLLEAMEKDKPSKDPSYWAKNSCRDCFGRGIIGRTSKVAGDGNTLITEQLCHCVKKAFASWQDRWVEAHQPNGETGANEVTVSALDTRLQASPVEERIERIDALCRPLREEIDILKLRRDAIPDELGLSTVGDKVLEAQQAVHQAVEDMSRVMRDADVLDAKANELYVEVKTLRHQAELLRTVERSKQQLILDQRTGELRVCEGDLERSKEKCARELHKVQKKIREFEDKLDRLEERRHRILKEHSLTPVIPDDSSNPT
jgi:archaellum component FlaC